MVAAALRREQREVRSAAGLTALACLHHLQRRVSQPLRVVDVAHERRNARARLRHAAKLDALSRLLEVREIDAVGQGPHEFVEHVHDLRTAALQILDDLHARQQPAFLVLQAEDLLDLLVELRDLLVQDPVALLLVLDRRAHLPAPDQQHEAGGRPGQRRSTGKTPGACACARPHATAAGLFLACQSKLRSARPQAVSSAVASFFTPWARAAREIFIWPSGSPCSAGMPTRLGITSATPGMFAQPPQTRICSGARGRCPMRGRTAASG